MKISSYKLHEGDCVEIMKEIPSFSIDAIITDPPYANIDRKYGKWDESSWREMMDSVMTESQRILKPKGSAVFILQPNSESIGRVHPWLWRFMADYSESWNMVQDVWWWNYTAPPTVHAQRKHGLLRPSVKPCLWFGSPDCYRDQDTILMTPAECMANVRREDRTLRRNPSGQSVRVGRIAETVHERGGSTPLNLLPIQGTSDGHSAGTPKALAHWWIRYICPLGGVVLDPFAGHGTIGVSALMMGRRYLGIEKMPEFAEVARKRLKHEAESDVFAEWASFQ